tara:strand:- start:5280 stop:5732 length:453 start_codon:yes stop_codon:yes gene_type:complete
MSKNKFKDTKLGKWLREKAPKVLDVVGDLLPDQGALGIVKNLIDKDPDLSAEDIAKANEMIKDMYELEVADRESARNREVEVKKSGSQDIMMVITGIVGLAAFIFMIYAVVYIDDITDNDQFIHLMGMIEGVVISNLFAYYYGTSSEKRK